MYAKVLTQVGLYNLAIKELQEVGLNVEALHIAIALDEIGLLCTKQELLEFVRKPD